MAVHLYLSLIPEALVVSMLPPAEFGQYYATGPRYKTRGQAAFAEVDPGFRHPDLSIEEAIARCVPHPDGRPKASVYISVYRVLERVPLNAIGDLHLTTAYGQTLPLKRSADAPESPGPFHLYQELAPVNTLVASSLQPREFSETVVTRPSNFSRFPALAFVELGIGELAKDPELGSVRELPYPYVHQLRESLLELGTSKQSKLVARAQAPDFLYRMVNSGFFIGNGNDLGYFPIPSHSDLRHHHSQWWRTANL